MTNIEEIWKDVPGYEGFYQVSNKGRVRSLDRIRRNGKNSFQKQKGIIISLGRSSGYPSTSLYKNNKAKAIKVHQLVAIAFLDHKPCKYDLVVNHKDFDRTNNNVDNLEIVTTRGNNSHKKSPHSSKYTGVYRCSVTGKWISCIRVNNKSLHLGVSELEINASKRYQMVLDNIHLL